MASGVETLWDMKHAARRLVLVALVITTVGCSSDSPYTDKQLTDVGLTWLNDLGLNQTSPSIWGERLDLICTASDESELITLADRFVTEDLSVSVRGQPGGDGSRPTNEQAADTLALLRRMACPRPAE